MCRALPDVHDKGMATRQGLSLRIKPVTNYLLDRVWKPRQRLARGGARSEEQEHASKCGRARSPERPRAAYEALHLRSVIRQGSLLWSNVSGVGVISAHDGSTRVAGG